MGERKIVLEPCHVGRSDPPAAWLDTSETPQQTGVFRDEIVPSNSKSEL